MGHDPARAATVGVLALLLVLTASLFPAGGFGSYPGADRAGVDGDDSTGTGLSALDDADATTATPARQTTATPTPTPTATPTPTPADDSSDPPSGGVDGPDLNLGAVILWIGGLAALALVGMVTLSAAGTVAKAGDLPDGRLPRVRLFLAAVPRATVAVLLGSGGLFAALGGAVARLGSGAGSVGLGGLTAFVRGIGAAAGGLATGVASLSLPSLSLPTGGLSLSTPDRGTETTGGASGSATAVTDPTPEPTDDGPTGPQTVREAWARFPAQVPGVAGRVETRTPGELARTAVAAGLPADAVETLTAAFRRVRYAGGVGETDRTDALAAFDRLRRDADDDADDGPDTHAGDGHTDDTDGGGSS